METKKFDKFDYSEEAIDRLVDIIVDILPTKDKEWVSVYEKYNTSRPKSIAYRSKASLQNCFERTVEDIQSKSKSAQAHLNKIDTSSPEKWTESMQDPILQCLVSIR